MGQEAGGENLELVGDGGNDANAGLVDVDGGDEIGVGGGIIHLLAAHAHQVADDARRGDGLVVAGFPAQILLKVWSRGTMGFSGSSEAAHAFPATRPRKRMLMISFSIRVNICYFSMLYTPAGEGSQDTK